MSHKLQGCCVHATLCPIGAHHVIFGCSLSGFCVVDTRIADFRGRNCKKTGVCEREGAEAERGRSRRWGDAAAPLVGLFSTLLPRRGGRASPGGNVLGALHMYGIEGAEYVNVNFTAITDLYRRYLRTVTAEFGIRPLQDEEGLSGHAQ